LQPQIEIDSERKPEFLILVDTKKTPRIVRAKPGNSGVRSAYWLQANSAEAALPPPKDGQL
jgi:hypothetical protein